MENQVRELASQIQAIKSKSIRPRYPAALKQAVLMAYRGAKRRQELLKGLGLGYTTVAVWLKADTAASKFPEPTFKSVSVSAGPILRPRLVLSNGISVENLSEEFIIKVLAYSQTIR